MTTTKKTPLTDILPPKLRKYAYAAYALAVCLTGIYGLFAHVPDQLLGALTAVGAALGVTAASNVKPKGVPRV